MLARITGSANANLDPNLNPNTAGLGLKLGLGLGLGFSLGQGANSARQVMIAKLQEENARLRQDLSEASPSPL